MPLISIQETIPPTPSNINLAGKTIVVTGSNNGLGYDACLQLLQLGLTHLIMAVRTISKGEAAKAAFLSDPTVQKLPTPPKITIFQLDLASFTSVTAFVEAVKAAAPTIDVLLLNAGMSKIGFVSTTDGHEEVFQVNTLATAILSLLLLPAITKGGRIAFVGSMAQDSSGFNKTPVPADQGVIKYMDDKARYTQFTRYSDSKLLLSLFVRELAKHVPKEQISINNFCPGFVQGGGLDVTLPWYARYIITSVRTVLGRSREEGARTLVYGAVVGGEETHGWFMRGNKEHRIAKVGSTVEGKEMQEKLWKETLDILAIYNAEIAKSLAGEPVARDHYVKE